MALRKITIDNSVKYIPQSEQVQSFSKDRDSKPKTKMIKTLPRKQDGSLSQNNKKWLKT